MAGPDFVNTLKEEDIKKIVYAAKDKPYMRAYLKLLETLQKKGIFKTESTLDNVAKNVSEDLLIYGIISERSRNSPFKDSNLLFHTHLLKDETGRLMDATLESDKETGLVFLLEDKNVRDIFPIGLVNDLREYELQILGQKQAKT